MKNVLKKNGKFGSFSAESITSFVHFVPTPIYLIICCYKRSLENVPKHFFPPNVDKNI